MSSDAIGYWPFWLGGLALAAVPLAHWLLLGRMFAVSGRYTSLNDSLRAWLAGEYRGKGEGEGEGDGGAMTDPEMAAAMCEATAAAMDPDCVTETAPGPAQAGLSPAPRLPHRAAQSSATHLLFFGAAAGGATIAALVSNHFGGGGSPMGAGFSRIFGESHAVAALVLFGGGLLVGFGTRMAGGCTSGHGLCGVSRLQPGSLLATAAFFGTGIAVSLALGSLAAGGT